MKRFPHLLTGALLLLLALAAIPARAAETAAPAATSQTLAIKITIDCSAAPELLPMMEKMKADCEKWFPIIVKKLEADTPKLRREAAFQMVNDNKGVAATMGGRVVFHADFYRKNPKDIGSAVHEMVHIIQGYRSRRNPGWLVEGLADAVRWWWYEPAANRRPIDFTRRKYTDSYQVTGAFLAWVEAKKDPKILVKLNTAMREGTYDPAIFVKNTGKDLDGLWAEFVAAQPVPKARKAKAAATQTATATTEKKQ